MALDPIKVGSPAPDFELPSSELGGNGKPGRPIRLSDYFGKRTVVLAFYPLDFSPVCTSENVCFQKSAERYEKANAQMLGISVDSAWTHAAFARELGLGYPLLADFHPRGEVARKYGLYLEESGYTARASVVVGKDGLVKMVQVQQIPEPRSGAKLLEFLEKLAASEG
jgi:mycoredoxin-dependent peroxiredoxin